MRNAICLFSIACFGALAVSATETIKVDPVHSFVLFSVAHNNVGVAYGRFNEFEGEVQLEDGKPTSFSVTVKTQSVDSGNEKRDGHLRKPDFFNAAEFPTLTFKSTSVKVEGSKVMVSGELTLLGKTKPFSIELEASGPVEGRGGAKIHGYHGKVVLKRSDYAMDFMLGPIGDEVTILISFEAST